MAWSALTPLTHDRLDEVAALAAGAFLHSPSYCYIFEGLSEARRLEALAWLFRKNFYLRLSEGSCLCGFKTGPDAAQPENVCAFMLQPPDAPGFSVWLLIMNGILYLPLKYGVRALVRLLEVMDYEKAAKRAVFNANPGIRFSALERMVVKPGFQGQGVGTRYLGQALAAEAKKGRAVLLSTQEECNVRFYTRLGFAVLHEGATFSPIGSVATGWSMARPAEITSAVKAPAEMPTVAPRDRKTLMSGPLSLSGVALGILAAVVAVGWIVGDFR
ncbi:unnamed protein product [Polarella glacialis]|uniref:N-acetyltransferase domain-containing protein n=1 Tax=Polarella glacialis TaxID=89957 RepID=A0A813IGK5_POLGL|nr:unnamed protein product [Polarella glacialis]